MEPEAYAKNFEEIDLIESGGWDYLWLGGGHFSTQGSMDPQCLMLAGIIAERTENIKIGTSIHRPLMKLTGEELRPTALPHERYAFDNLMLDDPFQTAEQVSIVDQVSKGRFIYGAGARSRGSDERRDYFFEFLEVMKQLWTEEHFSGFEGKYYNYPAFYESYMGIPKPTRSPILPCCCPWIARRASCPWVPRAIRSRLEQEALPTISEGPQF